MPENIEGVGGTLVEREPGRGRAIDKGTGEIYVLYYLCKNIFKISVYLSICLCLSPPVMHLFIKSPITNAFILFFCDLICCVY